MSQEEPTVENIEVLNRELLDSIRKAPDGNLTKQASAATNMIRRKIRENGFSRVILPHKTVSDDDLSYLPNTELPVVVEEMEPESTGAKSISFNDSADTRLFRGDKFVVIFNKITTDEYTKNVDELRTYKGDLRGVVTDNALKEIQTEEDFAFISTIDRLVGTIETGDGATGGVQHNGISGGIDRSNYVDSLSYLEDRDLNNGIFLMNRKTAKAFLKFKRDELGGDLAQTLFTDGLSSLSKGQVMGVRHIFTIKGDIVGNDHVYQFAEPNYLGRAYVLQNVTMYVEKKKDILRFSAMEKLGVTIANVAAVNKVDFGYVAP